MTVIPRFQRHWTESGSDVRVRLNDRQVLLPNDAVRDVTYQIGPTGKEKLMPRDDTFWGGLGQSALAVGAVLAAILVAAPTLLLFALPFFG